MKLVRYGPAGREKPGIIDADGKIRDLSRIVPDIAGETLSPKGLAKIKKANLKKLKVVPGKPRLGPCVGQRPQLHRDRAELFAITPPRPACRSRKSRSSSTRRRPASAGPNDDTVIPKESTKLDWEVELGIVIGQRARYLSKDKALSVVAGYLVSQRRVGARIPDRARPDNGPRARAARRSGRSGRGSSPATRSRTRKISTCGSTSTARSASAATPGP